MAGTGEIRVVEVPRPHLRPGWALVRNECSLISAGTERSALVASDRSLIGEVRADPSLVRKAVEQAMTDGLGGVWSAAQARLGRGNRDDLSALGYSGAGRVIQIGEQLPGIAVGDRVACGGAGWANHAEMVAVPRNLIAKVPANVSAEAASYATIGAIALHAVRQADVRVGERVGVIGLGLVGQLAVRILLAAGCEPFSIDLATAAVSLAQSAGSEGAVRSDVGLADRVSAFSRGVGLDAVLVCAASNSSDPLDLAAQLVRDRGRLVIVGDVPVAAPRAVLYAKELELRLARSYGPGRYDRDYEERGHDLPAGYVRWTEQRNIQAFIDLVGRGSLDPCELTTHRFPFNAAAQAYAVLMEVDAAPRPVGIVLEYPTDEPDEIAGGAPRTGAPIHRSRGSAPVRVGVVGAGSFAQAVLLPALRDAGAVLVAVASEGGLSATNAARRFNFERTAEPDDLITAEEIDAVVIATRHSTHAPLAFAAMNAGKAVFLEKPPVLDEQGLSALDTVSSQGRLMVDFNRRHAPLVDRLLAEVPEADDITCAIRVNAGSLPDTHWLHDREEGGGRLIGEGCHFVDLAAHLTRARVVAAHAFAVPQPTRPIDCSDSVVATLQHENGAISSIVYTGGGSPKLSKERIEVFAAGVALVLQDFEQLEIHGKGRSRVVRAKQDKGHRAAIEQFLRATEGSAEFPPLAGYVSAMRATFALTESLRTGTPIDVP